MARIPMVTRTITLTKATVLCVNTEARTMEETTYTVNGFYDSDADLLKVLQKSNQTESTLLVQIVSRETFDQLYGMTEAEFIKLATKLEHR